MGGTSSGSEPTRATGPGAGPDPGSVLGSGAGSVSAAGPGEVAGSGEGPGRRGRRGSRFPGLPGLLRLPGQEGWRDPRGSGRGSGERRPTWLRRLRRRLSGQGLFALALLLPSMFVVLGVVIVPVLRTLLISFFDVTSAVGAGFPFVGLQHYLDILGDTAFWAAVGRTLYFTVASTALELVLGMGLALLLAAPLRGRWLFRAVVVLPWALPTIVNGAMWRWLLNSQYGALNALLTQLHLIEDYRSWLGSPFLALNMVVVADVWKNTSLVAFFLLAGLHTIPRELYEAARADGAGALRSFWSITLPLLVPSIAVVLVLRTIEAFKVFDIIYVMTRGGPANGTQTVAYFTYQQAFSDQRFGYGSALAYLIVLTIMVLATIYLRLLRRAEMSPL
jgi:multiple sugar transport system permease protein